MCALSQESSTHKASRTGGGLLCLADLEPEPEPQLDSLGYKTASSIPPDLRVRHKEEREREREREREGRARRTKTE